MDIFTGELLILEISVTTDMYQCDKKGKLQPQVRQNYSLGSIWALSGRRQFLRKDSDLSRYMVASNHSQRHSLC